MITKYFKWLAKVLFFTFGSSSSNREGATLKNNLVYSLKSTDGSTSNVHGWFGYGSSTPTYPYCFYLDRTTTASYIGLCTGSGTTPATENDYVIETINNNFTFTKTAAYVLYNGNPTLEVTLTVTNTANTQQSLSEICMVARIDAGSDTSPDGTIKYPLLDRTTFTPIVFEPNEVKVIKYRVSCIIE